MEEDDDDGRHNPRVRGREDERYGPQQAQKFRRSALPEDSQGVSAFALMNCRAVDDAKNGIHTVDESQPPHDLYPSIERIVFPEEDVGILTPSLEWRKEFGVLVGSGGRTVPQVSADVLLWLMESYRSFMEDHVRRAPSDQQAAVQAQATERMDQMYNAMRNVQRAMINDCPQ